MPSLPSAGERVNQPTRRTFLTKSIVGLGSTIILSTELLAEEDRSTSAPAISSTVVAPPGSRGVKEFLARCTGCHLCVSACPTQVPQPTTLEYGLRGFLKPHLDFATAFCNFECRRCAELCIGCGACEHACPVKPDKAIKVNGLPKHAVAQKFLEPQAVTPSRTADFPF